MNVFYEPLETCPFCNYDKVFVISENEGWCLGCGTNFYIFDDIILFEDFLESYIGKHDIIFDIMGAYNHFAPESFAPCRFCPRGDGECLNCGFFRIAKEVDSDA